MLSAKDIREVRFAKSVGGYKQDEVDNLLDTIEEDYLQFDDIIKSLNEKISSLNEEIDVYKNSQSSLQNILIEAQKLADKTVADAKEKAALIINEAKLAADAAAGEAKNMLDTFDAKFSQKKQEAENDYAQQIEKAERRKAAVEAATADAVKRQQDLFNKTKIEISSFKTEITELYKKHLELIAKMPDCVVMDAAEAADAITLMADKSPDLTQFLPENNNNELEQEQEITPEDKDEGFALEPEVLQNSIFEPEVIEDEEIEEAGFKNKFFSRNK
ncbi:MAG: DivIVA domain-containing protein [Clostridia bacterium]|nr:DivIVA domain-containing protein [Clostridia bacterium]